MKDYTKKIIQDSVVVIRVPSELKTALVKLNLNVSAICRDALELAVKATKLDKGKK